MALSCHTLGTIHPPFSSKLAEDVAEDFVQGFQAITNRPLTEASEQLFDSCDSPGRGDENCAEMTTLPWAID